MQRQRLAMALGLLVLAVVVGLLPYLFGIGVTLDRPLATVRQQLISRTSTTADPQAELVERLGRLLDINAELQRRLAEYEEITTESEADVEAIILHRSPILTRPTADAAQVIEIGHGAVDQVHRGMAVTLGWSLVGTVAGEHSGRSLVRLITDPSSRIPAKLLGADGAVAELGTCAGTGAGKPLDLLMIQDQQGLEVEPGLFVVTLGGPGNVPGGLILGIVDTAERSAASDNWRITVRPLRDVRTVDTVLVLRDDLAGPR